MVYYLHMSMSLLQIKNNGFVTFFISDRKLNEMIEDVFTIGGEPPVNKKRKIIFKDYSGLTPREKMSIVGKLIGRSSELMKKLYINAC